MNDDWLWREDPLLDIGRHSFDYPVWPSQDWPPHAMDVLVAHEAEQRIIPSRRANRSKREQFEALWIRAEARENYLKRAPSRKVRAEVEREAGV
jgi:hypothetical protein